MVALRKRSLQRAESTAVQARSRSATPEGIVCDVTSISAWLFAELPRHYPQFVLRTLWIRVIECPARRPPDGVPIFRAQTTNCHHHLAVASTAASTHAFNALKPRFHKAPIFDVAFRYVITVRFHFPHTEAFSPKQKDTGIPSPLRGCATDWRRKICATPAQTGTVHSVKR